MGGRQSKTCVPKKVAIIGGGAAGVAAAWSLSRFPEKFQVELWEALPEIGGVASTCPLGDGSNDEINDQVQGGAPSYRNNLLLLQQAGVETTPVDFKIAFGTGEHAWSNHGEPSDMVKRLEKDIARFGKALKWVNRMEFMFIFVPIDKVLKWWGFSDEFAHRMVFPLTSLFFGTGQQAPRVSAAVVARVFLDPQLRLFEYSPTRLLDEVPRMFAFPKLRDAYQAIIATMPKVVIRTSAPVTSVTRDPKQGITVYSKSDSSSTSVSGVFDELIFACSAEQALHMLGKEATKTERKYLGNVRYYNDLIITHTDEEYMAKNYTFHPTEDMYFVRNDDADPRRIEMSFNLAAYQPHLQKRGKAVYQTIFLDDTLREYWTADAINPETILKQRTTRQFAHTWTHFAWWVPFASFIQGKKHTYYAGAYTLMNTHEIAVMSGFAAAERLGSTYPFGKDALAVAQYKMYKKIVHGSFR